jgi:putative tricarboxylic transport membrane protein
VTKGIAVTGQSGSPRRIGGEIILVVCFVVVTTLYLFQTFSLQRTMMSDLVGPAMFPQLVAGAALVLSTVYFIQLILARGKVSTEGAEASGRAGQLANLVPIVPVVFYVLILEPLGFLFSTAIYVFAAMLFFGRAVKEALIYAVAMAITFFVLFYYVLLTQVPMGWLVDTGSILPFLVDIRRAIGG